MTNNTADITVTHTSSSTTYENTELGIVLAAVYRRSLGRWRAACYFGPGDDEYDEETCERRENAERVAMHHAQAITDAL
jgi:hypothetical protein